MPRREEVRASTTTTRNSFSSPAETLLSLLRRLTATIPRLTDRDRDREGSTIKREEGRGIAFWAVNARYNGKQKCARERVLFRSLFFSKSVEEGRRGTTVASTIESIDRGPLPLFLSWRVSRRARRGIKATMNNYREFFEQNKQLTALDFTAKWRI